MTLGRKEVRREGERERESEGGRKGGRKEDRNKGRRKNRQVNNWQNSGIRKKSALNKTLAYAFYNRVPYHARTMVTKGWCEVRCFLEGVRKAFTQIVTVCFHKVILHLFTTDYSITTT